MGDHPAAARRLPRRVLRMVHRFRVHRVRRASVRPASGQLLGVGGRSAARRCTSPSCRRARPSTSTCLHGAVLDVVVDIRVGSPTFGRWDSVLLDDIDRRSIYVSEGLGHAFFALRGRFDGDVPVLGGLQPRTGSTPSTHSIPHWASTGRRSTAGWCCRTATARRRRSREVEAAGLLPTWEETRAFVDELRRR